MAYEGILIWTGASGNPYSYEVYSKNHVFGHDLGNYIFVKKTPSQWEAVYIGEGYLDDRTLDPKHLACAQRKGFTHYHIHYNKDEVIRKAEEKDMIAGNPECLVENRGCNKTEDG